MGKDMLREVKENKNSWLFVILISLIVGFLAIIPMISAEGIYLGADGTYHLARIESMADAIREGYFPVKIHFSCEFGFGYGSGFFYPNFLLYFPAILMLLGMTLDSAYKVFVFFVFVAIFFSTYVSIYVLTGKKYPAILSGALMVLSTPLFFSVYNMLSLGNYTAMIFMIPAISGAWGVVQTQEDSREELYYFVLFSGGFLGLFLTHTLSLFFVFFVCAFMMLFYVKEIFGNKKILCRIMGAIVTVVVLSAAYWMPMLEQFSVQKYKVSLPYINPAHSYSKLHKLIGGSRYGIYTFFLTIVAFIILVLILKKTKKNIQNKRKFFLAIQLLIISVLSVLFVCWKAFWMNYGEKLMFIQVPARILNVSFACLILSLGILFSIWSIDKKKIAYIGIALVFVSYFVAVDYLPFDLNQERELYTDVKITDVDHGDGSGGLEWLPLKCGRNFEEPNKSYANDGSGADGIKEKGNTEYKVWLLTSAEWYDIPYVYYKGYHAYLENGEEIESDVDHSKGLFRVYIPEDAEGEVITVIVKYVPTLIQKMSYFITTVGVFGILFFIVRYINKNMRNPKSI